ncbi:hypothetical protein CK203_033419 [Vitis vinifera]|uniref:Dirigent protein n=1 Tax=Vitis vinifera TaxID=29760 RepID=A0A438HMN1_VITVI|nr:hypothetical protein CK203_033419 [Vitis vinifera]
MPTLCFIWKEPSLTQVVGASSSLIKRKVVVVAFQSQHSTKPVVLFNMETPFSHSSNLNSSDGAMDPLTVTANRSSKLVGIGEGTSITSSLDGLQSISIAKITLRMKRHVGSISIVGGTHNIKPSDHPVVGGTGDFMFVQGYVTSSPLDLQGQTVVYKIEFHLYWPPYAVKKPSS